MSAINEIYNKARIKEERERERERERGRERDSTHQ